jgi:hypothetical protein
MFVNLSVNFQTIVLERKQAPIDTNSGIGTSNPPFHFLVSYYLFPSFFSLYIIRSSRFRSRYGVWRAL